MKKLRDLKVSMEFADNQLRNDLVKVQGEKKVLFKAFETILNQALGHRDEEMLKFESRVNHGILDLKKWLTHSLRGATTTSDSVSADCLMQNDSEEEKTQYDRDLALISSQLPKNPVG